MHKHINIVCVPNAPSFVVDMCIDAILLDVEYNCECDMIDLFYLSSKSATKIKQKYELYQVGSEFCAENLRYCKKKIVIKNKSYFLFEFID